MSKLNKPYGRFWCPHRHLRKSGWEADWYECLDCGAFNFLHHLERPVMWRLLDKVWGEIAWYLYLKYWEWYKYKDCYRRNND